MHINGTSEGNASEHVPKVTRYQGGDARGKCANDIKWRVGHGCKQGWLSNNSN